MSRTLRATLAEQTQHILIKGDYEAPGGHTVSIAEAMDMARKQAELFRPDSHTEANLDYPNGYDTRITLANETTLVAARRMVTENPDSPVLALNFASAKNPGGGWLGGSEAQEESLARASGLVPTLVENFEYYEHHRNRKNALYTDYMIHSPAVPVFRDDKDKLLDEPYQVGFLTSPAVNRGALKQNSPGLLPQLEGVQRERAKKVLAIAAERDYTRLVLGAWGCGVFQQDPVFMAGLFREWLVDGPFNGVFEHVHFAVLDRRERGIYQAFEDAFASELETVGVS